MLQSHPSRKSAGTRRSSSAVRLLQLSLLGTALVACQDLSSKPAPSDGIAYGESVALGAGMARTYIVLENGSPAELGVALSEQALTGLPTDHSPGGIPMPDGHHAFEYNLPFPSSNPTPFQFMGLGWNPAGHEPPGIYDLPHFDFHFYTITEAERNAIVPTDPQWAAKANNLPAPEYMPTGYVLAAPPVPDITPAKTAVPRMGVHWIDPMSPELHGQRFTQTFIYGTWDGKVTFAEPMITKAFLESKPSFRTAIAEAPKRDPAGWYPTEYRIYWEADAKEYRIALSGFAMR